MRRHRGLLRTQSGNFLVAVVLILGLAAAAVMTLVLLHARDETSESETHRVTHVTPTQSDYVKRGFKPNEKKPPKTSEPASPIRSGKETTAIKADPEP
ncbi:unnamed protein product, partial [marine sediment metagenome]